MSLFAESRFHTIEAGLIARGCVVKTDIGGAGLACSGLGPLARTRVGLRGSEVRTPGRVDARRSRHRRIRRLVHLDTCAACLPARARVERSGS